MKLNRNKRNLKKYRMRNRIEHKIKSKFEIATRNRNKRCSGENTGCFKVNDIMFLLISQPIKHLNRLYRSHIFTEAIAF